jgi:hypothetical protein
MQSWNKCKPGNTTATLLLEEVKAHGVPTDVDGINLLADVVGHMTQIQLHEASEMSPEQTLFILKSVWNILDVINFYITEIGLEQPQVVQARIDTLIHEHNDLLQRKDQEILKREQKQQESNVLITLQEQTIKDLKEEVMRLKARLWDMGELIRAREIK